MCGWQAHTPGEQVRPAQGGQTRTHRLVMKQREGQPTRHTHTHTEAPRQTDSQMGHVGTRPRHDRGTAHPEAAEASTSSRTGRLDPVISSRDAPTASAGDTLSLYHLPSRPSILSVPRDTPSGEALQTGTLATLSPAPPPLCVSRTVSPLRGPCGHPPPLWLSFTCNCLCLDRTAGLGDWGHSAPAGLPSSPSLCTAGCTVTAPPAPGCRQALPLPSALAPCYPCLGMPHGTPAGSALRTLPTPTPPTAARPLCRSASH